MKEKEASTPSTSSGESKKGSPKVQKSKEKKKSPQRLPFVLEAMITIGKIAVLVTGIGVAAESVLSGSNLIMVGLRTGGAILVVGLLFWGASSIIIRGYLEAEKKKLEQTRMQTENKSTPALSTMEIKA